MGLRSVLLHDEIEVEITPMNKHWEVSEETVAEYKRRGLEVPDPDTLCKTLCDRNGYL
jgi:hypothetical protein